MQPEAKFKRRLKEGFERVFVARPHYWAVFVASMMQVAGIPDIFAAADQHSVWIEAKVNDNGFESTQQLTLPTMAQAGARVVVLHADMRADEKIRPVSVGVFEGVILHKGKHVFRWADTENPFFWGTILGAWA